MTLQRTLGTDRVELLVGNPGAQEFWGVYGEILRPPLLTTPDGDAQCLDERVYLLDSDISLISGKSNEWRKQRVMKSFPHARPLPCHIISVVCCTGNLLVKPLSATATDDLYDAMAAHVAPLLLAIRNIGFWNKRTIFFACGSDPLSHEGSIDCGTYVMAKFAQHGLLKCAMEELPHATFHEVLLPNTKSALWSGAGIDAPEGSIEASAAARMLVGNIMELYNQVRENVLQAFDL